MLIHALPFAIKTYWVKSFKLVLPKAFSLFQLLICLTLLEKSKIPIINSYMTIQRIMIVKKSLGYFSVSFSERFMFTFIVIESILKLSFDFSNIST